MKELYLIPKQTYERMVSTLNNNSKVNTKRKEKKEIEWKTPLPPPPLQKHAREVIPLKVINTPGDMSINQNPSLNELLPITFKEEDLPRAKLLLKRFETSGVFKWDNNGDLFSPFNKGNIIDIIKTWSDDKSLFSDSDVDVYRYIISTTDIPIWMIKNPQLKKMMLAKDVKNKNKKNKMGAGRVKKISTKIWRSY